MAPQHFPAGAKPTAAALGARRWSRAAVKAAAPAPRKVRIVHLVAPEVFETDVQGFRGLVQRLTGKSSGGEGEGGGTPSSSLSSESAAVEPAWSSDAASVGGGASPAASTGRAVKAEAATGASPEEGGCVPITAEEDMTNSVFLEKLENFLFSS